MNDYENDLRGVWLDAEWDSEPKTKRPLSPVRYDIITGWIVVTKHYKKYAESKPVIELRQALGRYAANLDMRRIL